MRSDHHVVLCLAHERFCSESCGLEALASVYIVNVLKRGQQRSFSPEEMLRGAWRLQTLDNHHRPVQRQRQLRSAAGEAARETLQIIENRKSAVLMLHVRRIR